ncbi:class I SAM-dependent methyltransferase [Kiloniella laminariae]|uniref:Class I SAM-dependent methyltransferase n=1 Tax=Kiloniella laminariae TaxID=454162 RepID=A0ABT4LER1_9PROT|nr:class I SAM-dependent methyltransferase [Kiloniella laminariae]MCZ4279589.1 class I SAM-dependent methyltransferase [Kiloniella laminariae]
MPRDNSRNKPQNGKPQNAKPQNGATKACQNGSGQGRNNSDFSPRLKASWDDNAQLWTAAVREKKIASRVSCTDQAVVAAALTLIKERAPQPTGVLDLGCGEGWLVRRLSAEPGCAVTGIDGSADLIASACQLDPVSSYLHLGYDEIIQAPARAGGPYDLVICNFALLGEEITPLLSALRQCMGAQGKLVIQTLHPWQACPESGYEDGWQEESFAAFSAGNSARNSDGNRADNWTSMPWYFRTLASWIEVIGQAGFTLVNCAEPINPQSGKPGSLLLICGA